MDTERERLAGSDGTPSTPHTLSTPSTPSIHPTLIALKELEARGHGGNVAEREEGGEEEEENFQISEDLFVAAWVQTWAEREGGQGRGGGGGSGTGGGGDRGGGGGKDGDYCGEDREEGASNTVSLLLSGGGRKDRKAVLPCCPCLICRELTGGEREGLLLGTYSAKASYHTKPLH